MLDVRHDQRAADRALDEALAESFPASDPPYWTLGIVRPMPVERVPHDAGRGAQAVTLAPRPGPRAAGVIDVSALPGGKRTVIDALISLAATSGIVLLVPFAILLVGLPIALLVRGLLEACSWLAALVVR
jgi:hypothetical protein